MKTTIKTLGLVGLGCFTLASCDNDEFLEVDHYNTIAVEGQFENDNGAIMGLTGIYDLMNANDGPDSDWGFKPNLFSGCHPTMDTQATGWDKNFNSQAWNAMTTELASGWAQAYAAISRANIYLAGLADATALTPSVKQSLEGQARAIRGFFYTYLAQTFGRVPMLYTGEDYNTTPQKARAKDYAEMWDFIIDDFKNAADLLDWKPMNGQYGRCTKGMALSYLADAYMWKAYRCPETKTEMIKLAKAALEEVINSGTYELNPAFCTNWDVEGGGWNKECIWAEILDEGSNYSGWSDRISSLMTKWYTACPENGGWGSLYLSWEWYACFEHGDKRRDASCVTGAVPEEDLAKYGIEKSDYVYGYHPFLQVKLGVKDDNGDVALPKVDKDGNVSGTKTMQFHFTNGEWAPAIWSTKFWRNASAEDLNGVGSWGWCMWSPTTIYWKRYANVLIDYAECCFETGDENKGWEMLDKIRERAFGNLESGLNGANYIGWFNTLAGKYGKPTMTDYPIPFNTAPVTVTPAKEYYTAYAQSNIKGKAFKSEVWKVAVNEERRKEFNCEWCLRPDMQRSGFLEDHIETNYPMDATDGADLKDYPWTHRDFVYNDKKMDMPIPQDELDKNPLCDQNEAYLGNN